MSMVDRYWNSWRDGSLRWAGALAVCIAGCGETPPGDGPLAKPSHPSFEADTTFESDTADLFALANTLTSRKAPRDLVRSAEELTASGLASDSPPLQLTSNQPEGRIRSIVVKRGEGAPVGPPGPTDPSVPSAPFAEVAQARGGVGNLPSREDGVVAEEFRVRGELFNGPGPPLLLGPRSLSPGTLASEQLKLERSVLVPPVTGSAVAASSPSTSEPSAPGSAEAAANAASDAAADRTLELLAERCTSSSSLLDRSLLDESTPVTTGVLTHSRVNEKAKERIRQATTLASRGATYAARVELLSALRMLTQAADKDLGAAHRTVALAAGLRALEEASDFTAHGVELDADLNVAVIVASHRTPIAKSREACELMPQLAADLYYRYAQKQLGESVLGSPAGSMALYALGKLNSQLSAVEPQQSLDADRQAFAFQQAALIARRDNDMAAHELGVLMAEAGHYPEASVLLDQVARRQPHPTVLQNLACVQRHLGRHAEAEALQQQAAMLASAPGNTGMLQWLSPEAFAETAQATPVPIRTAHQPVPLAATPPVPR